ncbi:hypothetical protein ACFL4D_01790 [Candidatus Margulisiibacteriota bacterium]
MAKQDDNRLDRDKSSVSLSALCFKVSWLSLMIAWRETECIQKIR